MYQPHIPTYSAPPVFTTNSSAQNGFMPHYDYGYPPQIPNNGFPHQNNVAVNPQDLNGDFTQQVSNDVAPQESNDGVTQQMASTVAASLPASKEIINIENACLSFLHSEFLRKDHETVITSLCKNFGLDELKASPEALFKLTGTKRYVYKGPNDPATSHQKSAYCVASMIKKLQDLEHGLQFQVKFMCPSFDLFRLLNTVPTNVGNIESRLAALEQDQLKLSELEKEVNKLKATQSASGGPSSTFAPSVSGYPPLALPTYASRTALINNVKNKQRPQTPKRMRSEDGDFNEILYKKNGVRPKRNKPSFWGKQAESSVPSDLVGAEVNEVFLYNYRNTASPEVVKDHFLSHNISVVNVRQRSREDAFTKSFVMKISNKGDFEKVIKVLPYRTGARWYERIPPQANRPAENTESASTTPLCPSSTPMAVSGIVNLSTPTSSRPFPAVGNMSTPAASSIQTTSAPGTTPGTASAAVATSSGGLGFSVNNIITPRSATGGAPAFNVGGPLSLNNASMSSQAPTLTIL